MNELMDERADIVAPRARPVVDALRAGRELADAAFDALLPEPVRRVSARFWTPLAVVRRGVEWLDEAGVGDVLDIGAGAGKLCVAGALCDRGARRWIGLEHRAELVAAGRELAAACGVGARVTFLHHALGERALPPASAYYLFNPFGEAIAPDEERFDDTVELTEGRYRRDVLAAEALLGAAPVGTSALIYHGFGGRMGPRWEPTAIDYDLPNVLRLWVQRATPDWNRPAPPVTSAPRR